MSSLNIERERVTRREFFLKVHAGITEEERKVDVLIKYLKR
jgi:hypothetical protein